MKDLYFFHGLESSPKGTKAQLIKKHFPECHIPELSPDIHERATVLERLITESSYLVGSSLGGLSALLFSMQHPELVKAMILLAPAVGAFDEHFFTQEDFELLKTTHIPEKIPTTVIAGQHDDVIPLKAIKEMMKRSPDKDNIDFMIWDDDHSLNGYPELLLEYIGKMLKK